MPKSLFAVDLSLNFAAHPNTGDVGVLIDADAVKKAIRNLVLLRRGEKPFHPEIHSGIADLLFENSTPITMATVRSEIRDLIGKYEPRARNVDVQVSRITTGDIVITVEFIVQNQKVSIATPIQVHRTR